MLIFYLISKGIYAAALPNVRVEAPEKRFLFHKVESSGILEQEADGGVYVPAGLAVKEVKVHAGDMVNEGDVLFILEEEPLKKAVREQQTELEKLKLQADTLAKNRTQAEDNRQTQISRAKEQEQAYQIWKKKMQEAENSLQTWNMRVKELTKQLDQLKGQGSVSSGDAGDGSNQTLTAQKQEELDAAETALAAAQNTVQKLQGEAVADPVHAVEDAGQPLSADSSKEQLQLSIGQLQENLKEYLVLQEAGGKVFAKSEGRICDVMVQPGTLTAASAAMTLCSEESPIFMKTMFTKEQMRYVSQGMELTVRLNAREEYKKKLTYLTESTSGDGSFDGMIAMETGEGTAGQSGEVEAAFQTEQYGCCILVDALGKEENGKSFVYVLEESDGFFGKELVVRKTYVTVLDSNEYYAAVEPGVLDENSRVVAHTTGALTDGCIVRVE